MRGRNVALVAGLVILLILIAGWFGGGMMGYGRLGPYGGWIGPGMMRGYGLGFGLWGILMLLFWVLVIGGIVMLVVRLAERPQATAGPGRQDRGDSALDILRDRYARGEITKEQLDQMRKDLE